jgi:hypothetical protein
MKPFEFIYERVTKAFTQPSPVKKMDANGNVLPTKQPRARMPAHHVGLQIKYNDPLSGESWIVPDKKSFEDTFTRKYKRNYNLDIPVGFLDTVDYRKYGDYLVANLKAPYLKKLQTAIKQAEKAATAATKSKTVSKSVRATQPAEPLSKSNVQQGIDAAQATKATGFTADPDDPSKSYAKSVVANKSREASTNRYGIDNVYLINADGEALVFHGFATVPMIMDSFHQSTSFGLGVDLVKAMAAKFPHPKQSAVIADIEATGYTSKNDAYPLKVYGKQYPTLGWAKSGKAKIQFESRDMANAVAAAESAIASAFKGKNLRGPDGGIIWVNPSDRASAIGFALSHCVKTPTKDFPQTGSDKDWAAYTKDKELTHYVFGYFNTSSGGIDVNPDSGKQVFPQFTVGLIEKLTGFRGAGKKSEKRQSDIKPNTVLGMAPGMAGLNTVNELGIAIEGRTLNSPFSDIYSLIKTNCADPKKPQKVKKLIEITDETIGKSANQTVSYPVIIDDISMDEAGFATNAVTVDFMEILHPLILMKPDGAVNEGFMDNGIYEAALAFLGTTDLSKCKVFYPAAANAPMYDSILLYNNKTLMVSSKGKVGATPAVTGLGSAYLTLVTNTNLPKQVKAEFKDLMTGHPEYGNLLKYFNTGDSTDLPKIGKAKAIGQQLLQLQAAKGQTAKRAIGVKVAAALNELDRGQFVEFCQFVMSSTNLVQVNTMYDEQDSSIVVEGFTATWPNTVYDNIEFSFGNQLAFKLAIGGMGSATSTDGPDFDSYKTIDNKGKKTVKPRFAGLGNFSGLTVPGTKGLPFGQSKKPAPKDNNWPATMKELDNQYKNFLLDTEGQSDRIKQRAAIKKLQPYYDPVVQIVRKVGHNPSMETGTTYTTRDLLDRIRKLLGQ